LIDPHFTSRGNASRGPAFRRRRIDQRDRAAQRITRADRLQVGKYGVVRLPLGPLHHAVEANRVHRREAVRLCFVLELRLQRAISRHHQVGAEQKIRLRCERAFHSIGKEPHGAHARRGED